MRVPFTPLLSLGTDIVKVQRILRLVYDEGNKLERFARRILHPSEVDLLDIRTPGWRKASQETFQEQRRISTYIAGRWAAKEAAKKAWGASIIGFQDLRVEVSENEGDVHIVCAPKLLVHREPIEQVAKLSISHDGDYAIATVLASPLHDEIKAELGNRKAEANEKTSSSMTTATSAENMLTSSSAKEEKYEVDDRVAAVDHFTNGHLLTPGSNPYHAALQQAYQNSIQQGLPDIAVSQSQGKFLSIQVRIAKAKNILEIGTLGGYSSIWIASSSEEVKVTSLEVNAHHKSVAESNVANAGLSERINILLGKALDVLPKLKGEIQDSKRAPFDFVFIDADKENSLAYLELAIEMVKPGTCIYIDNVVRKGKLADPNNTDSRVIASRKLVQGVGANRAVDAVVIQTVSEKNYDGFLMAIVK